MFCTGLTFACRRYGQGITQLPVVERTVSVLPGGPLVSQTTVQCPTLTVGRTVNCSLVLHDACGNPILAELCPSSPRTCIRPAETSSDRITIGVHVRFVDASGVANELSFLDGGVAGPGVVLQIRTRYAGPAMFVIEEETASGNQSVTQPMQVGPADIDPELTSFQCAPSPTTAGARLKCLVTTRGQFGNVAGGADVSDFDISGVDAHGESLVAVPDGRLIPVSLVEPNQTRRGYQTLELAAGVLKWPSKRRHGGDDMSTAPQSVGSSMKRSGSSHSIASSFLGLFGDNADEISKLSSAEPTKKRETEEEASLQAAVKQSKSVKGHRVFAKGKQAAENGDWKKAVAYYHIALVKQREYYGEDHLVTSNTLNALGLALMHLGEHFGALTALEEALHIRQEALGAGAEEVAETTSNIWQVLKASQQEGEEAAP